MNWAEKCSRGRTETNTCWHMKNTSEVILVCNSKSKEFISTSAEGRRDERTPREKSQNWKRQRQKRLWTTRDRDRKPVVWPANNRRIQSRNVTMRALKHTLWLGSDKHAVTCTSAHGFTSLWPDKRLAHAQQMYRNLHILLFWSSATPPDQNSSKFTVIFFLVKTEATEAGPRPRSNAHVHTAN